MKKVLLLMLAVGMLSVTACKKKGKQVIVIKDCTGSYLRFKGKDYQVCNLEKVAAFQSGTAVTATFKEIKECHGSAVDMIVCMMAHDSEGWIEIEKIE